MKVWIVEQMDSGDNGWSIAAVCASQEAADRYVEEHPPSSTGPYDVEEFEVTA